MGAGRGVGEVIDEKTAPSDVSQQLWLSLPINTMSLLVSLITFRPITATIAGRFIMLSQIPVDSQEVMSEGPWTMKPRGCHERLAITTVLGYVQQWFRPEVCHLTIKILRVVAKQMIRRVVRVKGNRAIRFDDWFLNVIYNIVEEHHFDALFGVTQEV